MVPARDAARGSDAERRRALTAEVLDTVQDVESIARAWDAVAIAAGCPGGAPAWQLAWWSHLAPPGAGLRVVAVRDGGRLVGVAPFWQQRTRSGLVVYRLLAASMTHRVAPLAAASDAPDVAALVARTLAGATPAPGYVAFDAVDANDRWQAEVGAAWPGRTPWRLHERTTSAPVVHLAADDFAGWLAGKSRNFRQQTRRFRRRLADAGGTVRRTRSLDELERDVASFMRLHHARWDGRGGSSLAAGTGAMLLEAARALLPSDRFRLWLVELDGRPVSAQIFLAAGENVLYWNGGFDASAAHLKPALMGIVAGIEECFERGERRLDLGGGAHDYKLRLADDDMPLSWGGLVSRDARYLRNRVELLPRQLVGVARDGLHRLPPAWQQRARGLQRRIGPA